MESKLAQKLVKESSDTPTIINSEGVITYVSPSVQTMLGYDPEELIGENGFEYQHPNDREGVAEAIEKIREYPERTEIVETRFRRDDGTWCWVEATLQNRLDDPIIDGILVYSRDISDRKLREQQFSKAEYIADVGAWEYNTQTGDLFWTSEVYDIYGLESDEEVTSETAIEAFHPADQSKIRNAFEQAIETGESYNIELRLIDNNGDLHWVQTRGEQQIDNGTVRVRGTIQDITKQKKRQRKLERIETLFNKAQDMLFLIDVENGFTIDQVNPAWEEATGYSAEYVSGLTPTELFGEQQGKKITDNYRKCVEKREPIKYNEQLEFEDTTIWFETQIAPVIINGTVSYITGSTRNITDKKRRREKLQQMTNAVDNAPVGIVITDPTQEDNPLTYVNDGFVEQTGYTREEATGQNCRFLQGEETDEDTVAILRQAVTAEEPASVTIRNYRADGTEYWNRLEIAPITDSTGSVINYIGFQQDVTQQKRRKEKLKDTKQQLELVLSATDTGVWAFNPTKETILPIQIPSGVGIDTVQDTADFYLEQIHPNDRESVRNAIKTTTDLDDEFDIEFRLDNDGEKQWLRSHGTVVKDESGSLRVVGVTTEVTEQVRQKNALEKREQILRELHTATREFYPPESKQNVAETLVEFLRTAVGFTCISMKLFNENEGCLKPKIKTPEYTENLNSIDTIFPGSNPIWDVYRTGESDVVDATKLGLESDEHTLSVNYVFIAPIGNFGVLVVGLHDKNQFDDVDLDLIEVVTANVEAMFQAVETAEKQTQLTHQLSTQSSHIGDLQSVVNTIQSIQERVSEAESYQELDEAICDELTKVDQIDFVWVGRPQATDKTLTPTASAGGGTNYIDTVRLGNDDTDLPANIAATEQTAYTKDNISKHVRDAEWAKEAFSSGYQSVVSIPLIYDDVFYATITAYSEQKNGFDEIYENLLTDAGDMLLNYTKILDQRSVVSDSVSTVAIFEFDDTTYPLQQLAVNTESEICVKTITQTTGESITLLAEITAGDIDVIKQYASTATTIETIIPFGTEESNQLLIEIDRPFFATKVEKHGGKFVTSVSTPEHTQIRIEISNDVSQRPLFEFISSRFDDTELIAREEPSSDLGSDTNTLDTLTERQLEILSAAYYGGYYETPRQVTGENIAESFDISNPAVYNHLQAAHKKVLTTLFKTEQRDVKSTLNN